MAGILEKALRDEGSEAHPFETIVASGPRSALPHARASRRVVERGDLLLLDFGAEYGGYCSDVTRTVVVGRASDDVRAVYDIVRVANERAAGAVHAGMTGADADAYAKEVIAADFEQAGEEDVFRKVRRDFDAAGVQQSDHQIRRTMDELMQQAIIQIRDAT